MSLKFRIAGSRLGDFAVVTSARGLRQIYLPDKSTTKLRERVAREHAGAVEDRSTEPRLIAALVRYFAGDRVTFDVRLDTEGAGPFERSVWQACRKVPYGKTVTYGELARRVGNPKAARAVGTAMAHNRFPVVIPCHRVLRSNGELGGFSGPGGTSLKRCLLEMEEAGCAVT